MSTMLLKGGKVIDVISRSIEESDVLIEDGKIIFPEGKTKIDEVIDVKGAYVSPGFIDGHIHIESSMLSPLEFSREAILYGTTSVFVDPHEIANVLGVKGIEMFLEMSDLVPFTMNVGVSSCVPATDMETSGGTVGLKDIERLLKDDRVYGLAEMMNFPGIIHGVGDARAKVDLALSVGKIVDGHCPGLTGEDLMTYISNGESDWDVRIGSDHECATPEEAIEKWERGMYIMLRHGSAEKDLKNILPEICRRRMSFDKFGLVSDDLSAPDLRRRGHIDHLVSIAANIINKEMNCGYEKAAVLAISMATVNHARYFRKNTGNITDGADADIIVFDSLEEIVPKTVISKGKIVVQDGKCVAPAVKYDYGKYDHPINIAENLVEKLILHSKKAVQKVRVIESAQGSLLTNESITEVKVHNKSVQADIDKGILKIAVIERHKGTGNVSVGFIKGFGITKGAIASTVAHDSHNLVAVGTDEISIIKAVDIIKKNGGGLAAVNNGEKCFLPLALGGLMSKEGIEDVLKRHIALEEFVRKMGLKKDPFPMLSFMALPVIPKLKITDKGLVDVEKFDFVDLFVE